MPFGLESLDTERVATLATIRSDGLPHLVPITFAVVGDGLVWSVDDKPKSTRRLARIRHLESDSRVSILVSHYEEDWDALWWVRIEGTCRALEEHADVAAARRALRDKYVQYRHHPPPGPYFVVEVQRIVRWAAGS